MSAYKYESDFRLVKEYKQGNKEASIGLLKKYEPFFSKAYKSLGLKKLIEWEDFNQESFLMINRVLEWIKEDQLKDNFMIFHTLKSQLYNFKRAQISNRKVFEKQAESITFKNLKGLEEEREFTSPDYNTGEKDYLDFRNSVLKRIKPRSSVHAFVLKEKFKECSHTEVMCKLNKKGKEYTKEGIGYILTIYKNDIKQAIEEESKRMVRF